MIERFLRTIRMAALMRKLHTMLLLVNPGLVATVTPTETQQAEMGDFVYNTEYQFRIRRTLVTVASGDVVLEGSPGQASAYYKTDCIGSLFMRFFFYSKFQSIYRLQQNRVKREGS